MAEIPEQAETVAKEITLAAMEKIGFAVGEHTPEKVGNKYGKLYKEILKNVREAMHEKKYD